MKWEPPTTLPGREEWLTVDGIRCLLCGRWYRALVTHLSRTHDTSTDEYRERFGIARTTGLICESSHEAAQERARVRYEVDPRVRTALTNDAAVAARARATPAARAPRKRSTGQRIQQSARARGAARLQERLDAAGWATLADAVAWAHSEGVGWAAVSRRLGGMSITPLKERAAREGLSLPSYRTQQSPYENVRRARARESEM